MRHVDIERFRAGFIDEMEEHLETFEQLLLALDLASPVRDDLDALFRSIHSIKGGAATFGLTEIAEFAHGIEGVLDDLRTGRRSPTRDLIDVLLQARDVLAAQGRAAARGGEQDDEAPGNVLHALTARTDAAVEDEGFGFFDDEPPEEPRPQPSARIGNVEDVPRAAADASIRVRVDKIDRLINLVGEMVISHAKLSRAVGTLERESADLHGTLAEVDRNTREIQESVMSIRMEPIGVVFGRFPRMVRELAGRLGKEVALTIEGGDTELDRGVIERIADPLTHLVRNAIDHGVETAEEREALGKPAVGTLLLRAAHRGGHVVIEIIDDGRGLQRERIIAAGRTRGLTIEDGASDERVWDLVFAAGFSTAAEVTDVSGRGVGMDVVRRNVDALGGRIELSSHAGLGTAVTIRLPLTLAILDGLSVRTGDETYIVPLGNIIESVQLRDDEVHDLGEGRRIVEVRGEYLPLVALRDRFGVPGGTTSVSRGIVVLLEAANGRAALLVDELTGQHQVVIKSLEANFRRVEGISGATIMGDGRVALIVDAGALVRVARN